MIRILTLICSLTILIGSSYAQIEVMKDFPLGNHKVGFRYERIIDYSRAYTGGFRPVQLFIWYPAVHSNDERLDYVQYQYLNDLESEPWLTSDERKQELLLSMIQSNIENENITGDPDHLLTRYKSLETTAIKEPPVAKGNYPLLLFAPGGNTPGYLNSVLCEYLASHGYLVAAIPSLSNSDSLQWPFDQTGLALHIDDMEFAINHITNTYDYVDIDKIGLISWSVGGVSQGIYCMKNPNIDVLVSLDSGLGREYGIDMLKESIYFDYSKMTVPYLHFTGEQPEIYQVERSSEFYDSIASTNKYSLLINSFAHQHFASEIAFIPELVSENKDQVIIDSYVELSELTLHFLNAFLRDEPNKKDTWQDAVRKKY